MSKEREILTEQAQGEGKPPEIVAKMMEGRLRKSLNELALIGQPVPPLPTPGTNGVGATTSRGTTSLHGVPTPRQALDDHVNVVIGRFTGCACPAKHRDAP